MFHCRRISTNLLMKKPNHLKLMGDPVKGFNLLKERLKNSPHIASLQIRSADHSGGGSVWDGKVFSKYKVIQPNYTHVLSILETSLQ